MKNRTLSINRLLVILGSTLVLVFGIRFDSPVSSSDSSSAAAQQPTGISGKVFCVAKAIERPCAVGGISVTRVGDEFETARQTTGENGTFLLTLNPGEYNVVALDGSQQYPIVNKAQRRVRVNEQKLTEITLFYHDGRR